LFIHEAPAILLLLAIIVLSIALARLRMERRGSSKTPSSEPILESTSDQTIENHPPISHGELIIRAQRATIKELGNLRVSVTTLEMELTRLKDLGQRLSSRVDHFLSTMEGQIGHTDASTPIRLPIDVALDCVKRGLGTSECAEYSGVDLETVEVLQRIHATGKRSPAIVNGTVATGTSAELPQEESGLRGLASREATLRPTHAE